MMHLYLISLLKIIYIISFALAMPQSFQKPISGDLIAEPSQFTFENTPQSPLQRLTNNRTFSASCTTICIRKEIHDLTVTEFENYINAIIKLHNTPSDDPVYSGFSKFERYFVMHSNMYDHCHSNLRFLPWHRALMREFEKDLQAIDPTICVPYWDESRESGAIYDSVIFSSQYYGSFDPKVGEQCISDGAFAHFKFKANSPNPKQCIYRNMTVAVEPGHPRGYVSGWEVYNELANKFLTGPNSGVQTSFKNYAVQLEQHHGLFHTGISGAMNSHHSNCDPLFYLHHGFVDKTWNDFQYQLLARNFNQFTDNSNSGNVSGFISDTETTAPWSYTISDVLDTKHLCYIYAGPNEGRQYASQYKRNGNGVIGVPVDASSGYVGSPLQKPAPSTTPVFSNVTNSAERFGQVVVVNRTNASMVLSNGTTIPVNNFTSEWARTTGNSSSLNLALQLGETAARKAANNESAPDIGASIPSQMASNTSTVSNPTPTPTSNAGRYSANILMILLPLAIMAVY